MTIQTKAWIRYKGLDCARSRRCRVRNRLFAGSERDWHDQGIDRMEPAVKRSFRIAMEVTS